MGRANLDNLSYDYIHASGSVGYATMVTLLPGEDDRVLLLHHGSVVAIITPETVTVDNCGYDSVTTSGRINAALVDNRTGAGCKVKNGEMIVTDSEGTVYREFPVTFRRNSEGPAIGGGR